MICLIHLWKSVHCSNFLSVSRQAFYAWQRHNAGRNLFQPQQQWGPSNYWNQQYNPEQQWGQSSYLNNWNQQYSPQQNQQFNPQQPWGALSGYPKNQHQQSQGYNSFGYL